LTRTLLKIATNFLIDIERWQLGRQQILIHINQTKMKTYSKENFIQLKKISKKISKICGIVETGELCNGHMYDLINLVKEFNAHPIIQKMEKLDNHLTSQMINTVFK
jgi:hypothetical protein